MTEQPTAHLHLVDVLQRAGEHAATPADVLELARAARIVGDTAILSSIDERVTALLLDQTRHDGRAPTAEYRQLAEAWAIGRETTEE